MELKDLFAKIEALQQTLQSYGQKAESFASTQAITDLKAELTGLYEQLDAKLAAKAAPPAALPGEIAQAAEVKAFDSFLRGQLSLEGYKAALVASLPDEQKALSVDTSDGGVLIPTTISSTIIEQIVAISNFRELADQETIDGDTLEEPVETGSFAFGWIAERGTRAETATGDFSAITIPTHSWFAQPGVTNKRMAMSIFDLASYYTRKVVQAKAKGEGAAFIGGTGKGQPWGIMTRTPGATLKTGKADGFAASAPADCLWRTAYAVDETLLNGAAWLMRRATELEILLLKDGLGRPLWQASPNLAGGVPNTLCGFPVKYMPDMPAFGASANAIAFGNWREAYKIVDTRRTTVIRDNITVKGWTLFYTEGEVGGDVKRAEAYAVLQVAA
jgi:HK97 family phage major capsid protein